MLGVLAPVPDEAQKAFGKHGKEVSSKGKGQILPDALFMRRLLIYVLRGVVTTQSSFFPLFRHLRDWHCCSGSPDGDLGRQNTSSLSGLSLRNLLGQEGGPGPAIRERGQAPGDD